MPQTILIIDQGLEFGGSIVSAANLIRSIDPARFRIVFVSATSEALIRQKLRERGQDIDVVIARKKVNYNNGTHLFSSLRKSSCRILQRIGVVLFSLTKLLENVPYMLTIVRCIRKYNIDLVHLNNGIDDEVGLVCTLLGKPHVVYLRGHVPLSAPQRKFLLPAVSRFFAVSAYIRQLAIEDGFASEKIVVAAPLAIREPVGPDTLKSLRKHYGLADGQPAVGIFGRIVAWKGQKEFIEAAALVAQHSDARFFIVGENTDGEASYYSEVLRAVEELGLEDRVIFTGYIENVYDYYAMMDVVIHASIQPEPFGRVVLEAMSQGTPVIASPHGGPSEFIAQGEDGFLVEPQDSASLGQRILQVIQNPQLGKKLGSTASEKVDRLFNKQAFAKRMELFYRLALESDTQSLQASRQGKQSLQAWQEND